MKNSPWHVQISLVVAVILTSGCAMTRDEVASKPREVTDGTELWRPRPKTLGMTGIDARAREIESNLGFH